MATSLWGEEFEIPNEQETVKKIIRKVKVDNRTDEQKLKSKKTSIEEKIEIITQNVYKVLGHYKDIVTVIKSREELHNYIDAAIQNGIIAIDTETNNSLDPLTCLLMGGCIYTPGQNAAYIPINHVNRETNERLTWQCTERDIKEEFDRLNEINVKILTHNGKFDYKVLLCTCNYDMPIYWDSYVAARLLDENEPSAGLKQQYISKIDPTQEKYSIDHLFEELPYAIFDPELFAYYAAIDAYMTYKLYLWQVERFKDPNLTGVKNVFDTIEMPLIKVVAKMELTGIDIDLEYAERLSKKYHKLLNDCNAEIQEELSKYEEQILQWRLTPEANFKPKKKKITKTGEEFDKSKNEQLEDPVNTSSPIQLAILLYDILKVPQVSTKQPRGTGVEELKSIHNKTQLPICKMILKSRTLEKLINTFIDKLPNDKNPKDGKIHCEFLSLGTDTGRFSSKNPNLQNIPRSDIKIKPMFRAPKASETIKEFDNIIDLDLYDEVETQNGWVKAKNLKVKDSLILEDNKKGIIKSIKTVNYKVQLEVECA